MRGTRVCRSSFCPLPGIIPAHAGNTCLPFAVRYLRWDHPRACGEHLRPVTLAVSVLGSSPRMRGTRRLALADRALDGIIPAHAGNTCETIVCRGLCGDHPRACGEHGAWNSVHAAFVGSSPRMRGTLAIYAHNPWCSGIIPAHAGNTYSPARDGLRVGDHPRACGEHSWLVVALT